MIHVRLVVKWVYTINMARPLNMVLGRHNCLALRLHFGGFMGSPILEEKSHTLSLWVSNENRPSGRPAGRLIPWVQVTLVGCLTSSMESNDNVERSLPSSRPNKVWSQNKDETIMTDACIRGVLEAIHSSPTQAVLYLSGGASQVFSLSLSLSLSLCYAPWMPWMAFN